MPELPEVETVCRGLARAITGASITAVFQHRADLRIPFPKDLPKRLKGRVVQSIRRRAKYILIDLDQDEILLLHLGMSGRLLISSGPSSAKSKHDHLVMHFTNGIIVHLNDPRRFGLCALIGKDAFADHKLIKHLGMEPLTKDFNAEALAARLKGKKTSIKVALMDQRIVVGVGNIYACEGLFRAGINPRRKAGSCRKAELDKLVPSIQTVLKAAIKAGGSSLRDYVQTDGELGYFQHQFAVYGRLGKRCPECICDSDKTKGIRRIVQAGRSTFYCATRQR